jgi:hypothetical protein
MSETIKGKKYSKNARKIQENKKSRLRGWLEEFGDLSGILLNIRNNEYVAGNQRSDVLQDGELVIEARLPEPDKVGTVAYGYILYEGQRFTYREVNWDEDKHAKASLVANQHVAEWDDLMLLEHHKDYLDEVGFSAKEIAEFEKAVEDPEEKLGETPIYPIVPKFTEKHSAFVIICDNEVDENSIKEILGVQTKQSYKNRNTGSSHIITAIEFFNSWNKSQ